MDFGEKLKRLRLEKDWNQEEVAARMGVNRATVSSWEVSRREPPLDTARKLASLYGVSVDFLLGQAEERTPIDMLAFKWPRLSPANRQKANEIERGFLGPQTEIHFPPDITDETFELFLKTSAVSMAGFLQLVLGERKPGH